MSLLKQRVQRPALLAAGAGAAGIAFLMREVLAGATFYYRDVHLQWHPQVEAFVRAVSQGATPLWNPHLAFGRPMLANANTQVLYPTTWLNLVLPADVSYSVFVALHLAVTFWGMYLLGGRVAGSRGGGLVAAILWTFSGPVLSLLNLWNHLAGAAWLPWAVLGAERVARGGQWRDVRMLGAALAMMVLAGSPDAAALAALASAAIVLFRRDKMETQGPRLLRVVHLVVMGFLLALLLSAVQWLPTLELARQSPRAHLSAEVRTFWSLHPAQLAQVVLPAMAGRLPLHLDLRAALFEGREPFLGSTYLGLAALYLVVIGSVRCPRAAAAFGGLFLFAILLALGRFTIVHGLVVTAIPPLGALRFPAKWMVLAAFAWALLAGIGFGRLHRTGERRHDRAESVATIAILACGAVATALACALWMYADFWAALLLTAEMPAGLSPATALATPARALAAAALVALTAAALGRAPAKTHVFRMAPLLMTALVGVDLLRAHDGLALTTPMNVLALKPPLLADIDRDTGHRVYVYDYFERAGAARHLGHEAPFVMKVPPRVRPDPWAEAAALRNYLYPSLLAVWGLESAFDQDALALFPIPQRVFADFLASVEGTWVHTRVLQMASVSQVIALHSEGFVGLVPQAVRDGPFVEPTHVFRVPDPLPRAYVAGTAVPLPLAASLQALKDPAFDPRVQVLVPEGTQTAPPDPRLHGWRVAPVLRRADRLVLDVELDGRGYLVVVDGYDPGWQVRVNGLAQPVLRANLAFRAVELGPGLHRVEFGYHPRSVWVGLAITGATLFVLVLASLFRRRVGTPGTEQS